MADLEKDHVSHTSDTKMEDVEKTPAHGEHYSNVPESKEGGIPFVPPTAAEEKRVIRKLDWRLMPIVFFLYTLSVLDRSNLGNAKLAGMEDEINLGGWNYNWLGTIFYIAYIFSQWLLMGWKQFPPHIWCSVVVLVWGFIASVQAGAFNWGGLMTCRFFLGVAEAAFGPGVPFYLTFFYPRESVGLRQGFFISGAALANAYGGALAYGIASIKGSLAPWKILFLIEGLPTIVFALIPFFFLPDSIATANFFTDREKDVCHHLVSRNQHVDAEGSRGLKVKEVLEGLKDPKSFLPGVMYFSCNVSYASLPLFVPTIISELGIFTTLQSNGLSAPPYLLCFFYINTVCYLSDRFRVRGPFCGLSALLAFIGFVINATSTDPAVRYFSIFLSVLVFASVALLLAWVANIHATESRRAGGYTVLATLGQCGPLLGTNVFPASEEPLYRTGLWISAAFCLLIVVCSIILSVWLFWENKKLDREEGPVTEGFEETSGGVRKHRFIW